METNAITKQEIADIMELLTEAHAITTLLNSHPCNDTELLENIQSVEGLILGGDLKSIPKKENRLYFGEHTIKTAAEMISKRLNAACAILFEHAHN